MYVELDDGSHSYNFILSLLLLSHDLMAVTVYPGLSAGLEMPPCECGTLRVGSVYMCW
jgi:hypothetical protein